MDSASEGLAVMDFLALYRQAVRHDGALAGFYNRNVRVDTDAGAFVIRIPMANAEAMDLTLWPEVATLGAVSPQVPSAPRLIHASDDPEFQVHAFIEGDPLDDRYPVGTPLPGFVLSGIAELFKEISDVPSETLPKVPDDWPESGDTAGFAARLTDLAQGIRDGGGDGTGDLYRALGVPADPFEGLSEGLRTLAVRPFRLLHADVHRKNMILDGRRISLIDWELALWGDPVYDLADHLHKMSYLPKEEQHVVAGWMRATDSECHTGWERDLPVYRGYERIKSVIVDTVRWSRRIAVTPRGAERRTLAVELMHKIGAARPYWSDAVARVTPEAIEAAAASWAETQGHG